MLNQKRFHTALSDEYDLSRQVIPQYDELQTQIAQYVRTYAGALKHTPIQLIEIGVGTGLTTRALLAACPELFITGIDDEPNMLQQARQKLQPHAHRITLLQTDALTALQQQAAASIDVVASSQTLHNFQPTYRASVFQAIARVLKPGGLFINGDKYARDNGAAHQADLAERLEHFKKFAELGRPDLAEAWTQHNYEDEAIKIREGEQLAILRALGFQDVGVVYRAGMEAIIIALQN